MKDFHSLIQALSACSENIRNDQTSNAINERIITFESLNIDFRRAGLSQMAIRDYAKYLEACNFSELRNDLFAGKEINNTEKRAVLHTRLRNTDTISGRGEAGKALYKMLDYADTICARKWLGATRKPITDIVNIGIGGSDLGPRMICTALEKSSDVRVHFVSNVDPDDLDQCLALCTQETTLFVISSKSFGTLETLENALSARRWLLKNISEQDLSKHLLAVSSNIEKATAFGIAEENIFPMWDWVGGRFSLWSAIGLPIAIQIGREQFLKLLEGAHAIDQHFLEAKTEENLPLLLALFDVINFNVKQCKSSAVIPYSHRLRLLPDYLQQLCMESNGKSVSINGESLNHSSYQVLWGSSGTIGQHSFHQLLHQGTETIPVEFILPINNENVDKSKHQHLVANCLAQSKALTEGKTLDQAKKELLNSGVDEQQVTFLAPHKVVKGDKPNVIIGLRQIDAYSIGQLIALYEHRVFSLGALWGINSFDQWGVEIGKQLSLPIYDALSKESSAKIKIDSVTNDWIAKYKNSNS